MADDIVTELDTQEMTKAFYKAFPTVVTLEDAMRQALKSADERDKWQIMAADLAEHLENALYSDEWKTREYAIVAFGMFERALPHWRKGRNPESTF
jgi:hypothetical protein